MLAEAVAFWGVMVCSVPARTQGTSATAPGGARGSEETPHPRRLLNLKSAKLQCVPEQGKSQLCADLLGGPFGM